MDLLDLIVVVAFCVLTVLSLNKIDNKIEETNKILIEIRDSQNKGEIWRPF